MHAGGPAISLSACRILVRALEVVTMFSQSCLGVWVLEVMISTWSPLFSFCFSCAFLPFTFAPMHLQPSLLWIWKAKSSTVAPLASLNKSPLGVKTNTSSSYKIHLELVHYFHRVRYCPEFSSASRTEVSHSSRPLSPLIPLYLQCAARPRSAISSIRSGTYLHFHPFAFRAHYGDVQRLVTIAFGHRQPVAQTLGVGLVHIRYDGICLPAFQFLLFGFRSPE